jgi:hypothetical protein
MFYSPVSSGQGSLSDPSLNSSRRFSATAALRRILGNGSGGESTGIPTGLNSLTGETSPQVFYRDLLTLAREWDQRGEEFLAHQVFQGISLEPNIPHSIREEAQAHALAIRGEGPLAFRMERSASRFLEEVTAPELLVGMGAGSLGFGLGRAFGLRSLAGMGIRGSSAVISGRLLGLAAEATAFTLASRSVARWTGHSQEGVLDNFATHWASAALMMGSLRITGWGIQKILGPLSPAASPLQSFGYVSAQQGGMYLGLIGNAWASEKIGWVRERPWDAILAASAAELLSFQVAGRLSRQMFHPTLGNLERALERDAMRVEERAQGTRDVTQGALAAAGWGAEGLIPMVFNMGSDNGGSSDGSGPKGPGPARPRFQTLTFETKNIGLPGDPRRAETLVTIMRRIRDRELRFEEEILKEDFHFTIEGAFNLRDASSLENLVSLLNSTTDTLRRDPSKRIRLRNRQVVIQIEANPAADRPQAKTIRIPFQGDEFKVPYAALGLSESTAMAPMKPQRGARSERKDNTLPSFETHLGKGGRQLNFANFTQLTRRIMEKRGGFEQALIEENMAITLESDFGWNLENLLRILNFNLPRLEEIPELRRINLKIGPEQISEVVWKNEGSFSAPLRSRAGAGRTTPAARVPRSTPQRVPKRSPKPSPTPPSSRKSKEGPGGSGAALSAQDLPNWVITPENIMVQIRRVLAECEVDRVPVFILEHRTLTLSEIQSIADKTRDALPEESRLELLVPENAGIPQTFTGEVREGKLKWSYGNQEPWNRAGRQAIFDTAVVRSPAEIYQHLYAMAGQESRGENSVVHLKQRGEVSQDYLDALGPAIQQMLRHFTLKRNRLILISEAGSTLLAFERKGGLWTETTQRKITQSPSTPVSESDRPTETPPPPRDQGNLRTSRNFKLVRIPTQLLQHWKTMLDPSAPNKELDLLLGLDHSLTAQEEIGIQRELAELPEGRRIALHDLVGKQTLNLRKMGGRLAITRDVWRKPSQLNPLSVSDPVDLFHQLAFVAEQPAQGRTLKATTIQDWPGAKIPVDFLEALNSFRNLPYRHLQLVWPGEPQANMKPFTRRRLSGWQEG